jgi:hypothetical protein
MPSPAWIGASSGYVGLSGQLNQLLGSHSSVFTYGGSALQASGGTGSAVYLSTETDYLAQEFTTGASQTVIGSVSLQISAVGGSPITATISPLTVELYASTFGVPTGSPLAVATVTETYVYSQPFWCSIPLAVSGLTASTQYQLVVSPVGTSSAYYAWQQSNSLFGASTSPDNATWTAESYGLMYEVYDSSGTTGNATYLVDDGGARFVQFTYNANGTPATITEYTQTQNGAGISQTRSLTYSGNQLIGIA